MKLSDPADPIPNIVHEAVGVIAAYVYAHPITVVCSPRAGGKANLIDANGRYGIAMALREAGLLNVERTGDETPNPKGDSVMSKFKPGDRVRATPDHSMTATVLAAYRDRYWVKYDDDYEPTTMYATDIDRSYELAEPFLPNGDRYSVVYANGVVSTGFASLAVAERVYRASAGALGIVRIDGQTGDLSWAKGGPKEARS